MRHANYNRHIFDLSIITILLLNYVIGQKNHLQMKEIAISTSSMEFRLINVWR
ncbi:MAG: hypothetical protein K0R16_2233 [Nitrososphaeraceae archaeon]|nr:hypothetical protein [Nitrososphaeraceae archaeon]